MIRATASVEALKTRNVPPIIRNALAICPAGRSELSITLC